jgi:hypothetical protein
MKRSPLSRPAARGGRDRYIPRLLALEAREVPSTCVVNSLGDAGVGTATDHGDLRYCINRANNLSGTDTITFAARGTINLTGALPDIVGNLTLAGPGADLLTVRRDSGGNYRIFSNSATTTISGLTIADGLAYASINGQLAGGGIYNAGQLTVDSCVIRNNEVYATYYGYGQPSAIGGGIYNAGTMTLLNSRVTANLAYAELTSDDPSGEYGKGGVIGNGGHLTVLYSRVDGNTATSDDPFELSAVAEGGGIFNKAFAVLDVRFSSIDGNSSHVFYPYAAGGGLYNEGVASLGDTTVAVNAANGDIVVADGGGIENTGTLTIANSTVAGNYSAESGGGIFSESNAMLNARDSIVADNHAGFSPDLGGSLTTSGYNLFGNSAGGSGYAPTDLLDVDAKLGPDQDNGGPTPTTALLPGSPAIDSGDNTNAPEWDQRGPGFPRIVNGTIDIGAFEVQNTGAAPEPPRGVLGTVPLIPHPLRTPPPAPAAKWNQEPTTHSPSADMPVRTKTPAAVNPYAARSRAAVDAPVAELLGWDWA